MVLEKIEVQATFEDEITSRVQNALDTMVEFGATTEQVSQAFNQLNKAQKAGAKGIAQQANVMRTLVDESESAEFALRNVGKATEIAAQAGLKLEDAGRQLGMAFKGDTTILRNFDAQARRAAAAIEKINNPAERQTQIMRELAAAQRRSTGTLNRFQTAIGKADVKLSAVGLSVGALATGLAGLGLAATTAGFAVLTSAVSKYRETNELAQESTNALEMSLKRASDETGSMLNEFLELNEATLFLSKSVDDLTDGKTSLFKEMAALNTVLSLVNKGFAALDEHIIGVTKTTEHGTQAILSFADRAQILIGIFDEATAAQRRLEQAERKASMLRRKRMADDAAALDKADAEAQKRLEQQMEFGRKLGAQISTAAGVPALVRATIIQEQQEAFAKEFGPDFTGPAAPPPAAAPPRGRGRRAQPAINEAFMASVEATREYNAAIARSRAAAASFEASQQELLGSVIQTNLGLDANMGRLDGLTDRLMRQIELTRLMQEGYRDAGAAVTEFANGAVQLATNSVSLLFENLAAGQNVLANFGVFLLKSTGDLLGQMGQAFIMLGAGVSQIQTGLLSPGALIAIGVGMVALSGALKGFAARAEGAGGAGGTAAGGTAAALERFGRRIFERGDADQGREVTINIEGRSMRGYVLDVAADGARRGSVPLTPRRA